MQATPDSTAFEYLLFIDRKCAGQQGGLVQQESDASYAHGLAFHLGSHQYIIPITDIDEIIALPDFTGIPRAPSWLKGVANVRGNLVTLLDLHDYIFGVASKAEARSKRTLLVKQESHYYGLVIDSIIGMKSFHQDQGSDLVPEGFDADYLEHISAFYSLGEEWFAALSVNNLLLDERFKKLASRA